MAKKLTPRDDRLAALLADVGFSFRQIGELMKRDDKTVKSAAERGRKQNGTETFTVKQEAAAKRILGFTAWLDEGRDKGYLPALAAHLEGCAVVVEPESDERNAVVR